MTASSVRIGRLRHVASAVFFVGYLLFQVVYPSLAWFRPEAQLFSWHMYAGGAEPPVFSVLLADGSTRRVGDLFRPDSSPRALSASMNFRRFVPPYLCARWQGAREVHALDSGTGHREVTVCPSVTR